ncbi:MAG TPA: C45 family peptidase [Candidatus Acidoferrales bacterium]|nr:C45 family peptidase [Candidatus Acidoferrales bacterium]
MNKIPRRNGLPYFGMAVAISLSLSHGLASSAISGFEAAAPKPALASAAQDVHFELSKDKGYRFERDGWVYVHLEGTPYDVGYQHGYLLATEIADAFAAIRLEMTHDTGRDWNFFRRAAHTMLWPRIDPEYQFELKGIVDGLHAKDAKLDLDDIVAFNAFSELPDYYVPWLNTQAHRAMPSPNLEAFEHCSAFVATGSWTKDHGIVMAHSNWTTYIEGARWRIIFDIIPRSGYRILMDGFPGVIASDDDFGVNSSGLMITETTIGNFHGWDPNGKAEFVRARKAMQYADSIDSYMKIMLEGNNGGYANDWLLGDRKTGEIARFELGLKHTKVWRTSDGYFSGANFPTDPDLIKEETSFDPNDPASGPNARRIRWDQLLNGNKGKIDSALAEAFLADHYDTFAKKEGANRRTLCGHGDMQAETLPGSSSPPFDPYGAVQGKVIDSRMAASMSFLARIGHPCGIRFDAAKFLANHPEFSWQSPVLLDLVAGPWTEFRIGEHVTLE